MVRSMSPTGHGQGLVQEEGSVSAPRHQIWQGPVKMRTWGPLLKRKDEFQDGDSKASNLVQGPSEPRVTAQDMHL